MQFLIIAIGLVAISVIVLMMWAVKARISRLVHEREWERIMEGKLYNVHKNYDED